MSVSVEAAGGVSEEPLREAWTALEARAPGTSFFQGWTWVGCCFAERFPDPVVIRAEAEGRCVGLALFHRAPGRLLLTETGEPDRDSPFVELNAPLIAADAPDGVAEAIWRTAWRVAGRRRLVLSGVEAATLRAAGGRAWRHQERPAPYVDLAAVRASGGDHLAGLSANARYQIRRSERRYAERGPILVERAADLATAEAALEALIALHTASWQRRGRPGAFATPFQRRFHGALIRRALPAGEVDLWSFAAGGRVFARLYNLRRGGHVLAYQSGFDDAGLHPHEKPGLTAHALAIGAALREGDRVYDFLAGDQRYKETFANASRPLIWAELVQPTNWRWIAAVIRSTLQRP